MRRNLWACLVGLPELAVESCCHCYCWNDVVEAAVEDDDCWLGKIQTQLGLILDCELLLLPLQQQLQEWHAESGRLELPHCGRLACLVQQTWQQDR